MLLYLMNKKAALIADGTTVGSMGAAGTAFYMSASKSPTNRVISVGNGKVLRFTDTGYTVEAGISNGAGGVSPDGDHIGNVWYDSSKSVLTSGHYVGGVWQLATETVPGGTVAVNWFDANTQVYTHGSIIPYIYTGGVKTNLGTVALANPYARFDANFTTILLVGHGTTGRVFQKINGVWDGGTVLPGTKTLTWIGADMSADGNVIVHPLTNGGVGVFVRNAQHGYDLVQTIAGASAAATSADGSVIAVTSSGGYARVYKRNGSTYALSKTSSQLNVTATYPNICVEPQGQYVTMSATTGFVVLQA